DVGTGGVRKAEIFRGRQTAIVRADEARSRPLVRGQQTARVGISRAVVHDDDLEVLKGLGEYAVDRLVQVRSEVVTGNDDRDSGRVHDVSLAARDAGAGVWTSAARYRPTTSCDGPSATIRPPSSSSARSQKVPMMRASWLTMRTVRPSARSWR